MQQSSLNEFESDEPDVPYEVPTPKYEPFPRAKHRYWYWKQYDKEEYECPWCGDGYDEVERFHVHHIDENPYNGHPDNLLGICKSCHREHHGYEPQLSGLSVNEWKNEFLNITDSDFGAPAD